MAASDGPSTSGQHEEEEGDEPEWHPPKHWQRFYLGYEGRFVQDCVLELQDGRIQVALAQAPSAKQAAKKAGHKLDKESDPALTGTTVWDGAVCLSQYLTCTDAIARHQGGTPWPSGERLPHVIELGAGTGAVGLALLATRRAASATITDLPDMLPHLRTNVSRNSAVLPPGRAHVQALHWGERGQADIGRLHPAKAPFDVIVGSDLIYYSYSEETPHSRLLLWTLAALASPASLVYLALSLHHNPQEVRQFLRWAAEGGFEVTRLHRDIPDEWRAHDVTVVLLRKLPPPLQEAEQQQQQQEDRADRGGGFAAAAAAQDGVERADGSSGSVALP